MAQGIKRYNPNAYTHTIKLKRIDTPLLLVAKKTAGRQISIYDESNGFNEIASIRYAITGDRVFISSFEVREDYQRKGIGRYLFEFALAHGDALCATSMYGHASPTAPIKNVSQYGYKYDRLALQEIYTRLGCKFSQTEQDKKFVQRWQPGDKLDSIDIKTQDIIYQLTELELNPLID